MPTPSTTSTRVEPAALDALRTLPARALLSELKQRLAETIRDQGPSDALRPWLDATSYPMPMVVPATMDSREASPLDLLHLAVSSRRTDLLEAVLRTPALQPHRVNTGLPLAIAHPDPSVQPWGLGARAPNPPGTAPMADDPLTCFLGQTALPPAAMMERNWRLMQHHQPMMAGFRAHSHTNLVGLAVMMGWDDGVAVLLAHGTDPYARAEGTSPELLLSPVMLALHYQNPALLARLIGDSSWDVTRSYGFSNTMWTAKGQPLRSLLLEHRSTVGGLELEAILDQPLLANDARVIPALGHAIALRAVLMDRVETQLSDERRRVLEGVLLRHEAMDAAGSPLDARARPRL